MKLRAYAVVAMGIFLAIGLLVVWNVHNKTDLKSIDGSGKTIIKTVDKESLSDPQHSGAPSSNKSVTASSKNTNAPLGTYDVPEGPVGEVFDRLKARADQGDGVASFGIYQKLKQCAQLLSRGVNEELVAAYEKAGHGDAYLQGIERQAVDCQGAAGLLKNERPGLWLERAADQGALIAQLVYAADQPTVLGTPQDMINNPEKLIQYKKKAMGFLHSAASSGSSEAMFDLANAYTQGFFTDRAPERAYAYAYAAALRSSSPAATQLRDRYAADLSTEQVQRGTIEGKRIFDQCCNAVK